jgi:F-box-like
MISSDPRRQLEEFDSQIARLGARLEQLKEKRVPLKRQINQLCAPVLRLPPELSSEIFLAYLPLYQLEPQKELALTPLIFGSVCSDWRNQAWSMPWLWNKIVVHLDICTSTICELLEEWLSRCGDYPLSIAATVEYGKELDLMNPNVTTPIAIIASFCETWHSISFHMPYSLLQTFHCIQGRLPRLTSIHLIITHSPHSVDDTFQLFSVGPEIRDVDINFRWNGPILPLKGLTNLSTPLYDFAQCLDVLRHSPCLVTAEFSEMVPSDITMLASVTAPQLKQLSLDMKKPKDNLSRPASDILDALTFPSLCELEIIGHQCEFRHTSFISFINRSSCSLTHLKLYHLSLSADHILQCFRIVPSVVNLHLTGLHGVMSNDIIRMLDPSRTSESSSMNFLLPNLRKLFFSGEHFDWLDVSNMLACRWSMPTTRNSPARRRLCTLTVNTNRENRIDESAKVVMQRLIAEGMDVCICPFLDPNRW